MAGYVYLTTTGVNIRKGPDNKKKVLRTVPSNRKVNVIQEANEWWWKVEYEGTTGYIAKELIKVSYPRSVLDYGKKNPIASVTSILLLIGIIYYASGSNKSEKKAKVIKKTTQRKKPKS
jgi:SH3-like domain-containing protein